MEMKCWHETPVALFRGKDPGARTEAVQKDFGSCGKQKNLTLPVIEPRFSNHATCSQLTIMKPWLISNLMHKIHVYLHIIHLLKSSTCFEHYHAHLQDVLRRNCIYAASGIVTLCRSLSRAPVRKVLS
jgi:hypothetical protein